MKKEYNNIMTGLLKLNNINNSINKNYDSNNILNSKKKDFDNDELKLTKTGLNGKIVLGKIANSLPVLKDDKGQNINKIKS